MENQKFKGDAVELQMEEAGKPPFDLCSLALDDFFANGFTASPFLLMLFDEGRAPFSDRVPRDSFVAFINEALTRFPFTGSFESYIFIIKGIFGSESDVLFSVPSPGKLQMIINSGAEITFDFTVDEFVDGEIIESSIVDQDDNQIVFQGISGIDNQYQLQQLLSELIPAGIFPEITLDFFTLSDFVEYESGTLFSVGDHAGNQIVFFETG